MTYWTRPTHRAPRSADFDAYAHPRCAVKGCGHEDCDHDEDGRCDKCGCRSCLHPLNAPEDVKPVAFSMVDFSNELLGKIGGGK